MTGVLLSGGLDSIALTFWKNPNLAYTIDYGQVSAPGEIRAAKCVCRALQIEHQIITVDCGHLGSGDLANREPASVAPCSEWWPFRNQLLLTIAAMEGVGRRLTELLIGAVKSDGIHADGTASFIGHIDRLFNMQEGSISISAPGIGMTSVELIKMSGADLSLLAWAHSCHRSEYACGNCRGCTKHKQVMGTLGYGFY